MKGQGFPNQKNETLQPDTTLEDAHKPLQPFFVIAINYNFVVESC